MATIDPAALSKEIGISFTKVSTISSGQFDEYLNEVDASLWSYREVFGGFVVIDTVGSVFTVHLDNIDGIAMQLDVMAGLFVPLRGLRIRADTTASAVTVFGGQ